MQDTPTKTQSLTSLISAFQRAQKDLKEEKERLRDEGKDIFTELYKEWYQPNEELKKFLIEYMEWSKKRKEKKRKEIVDELDNKAIGNMMEKIAALVFQSLVCAPQIEAYSSFASQTDLVVFGHKNMGWDLIMGEIGLDENTSKIIVEAKNLQDQVDSNTFSRLCYLVEHQYPDQCRLGIFFSRKGAKGFPERGQRQISLRSARATQIMFHVSTKTKYVVVFDEDDILNLANSGTLIHLLRDKISDIENVVGEHLIFPSEDQIQWTQKPTALSYLLPNPNMGVDDTNLLEQTDQSPTVSAE